MVADPPPVCFPFLLPLQALPRLMSDHKFHQILHLWRKVLGVLSTFRSYLSPSLSDLFLKHPCLQNTFLCRLRHGERMRYLGGFRIQGHLARKGELSESVKVYIPILVNRLRHI